MIQIERGIEAIHPAAFSPILSLSRQLTVAGGVSDLRNGRVRTTERLYLKVLSA